MPCELVRAVFAAHARQPRPALLAVFEAPPDVLGAPIQTTRVLRCRAEAVPFVEAGLLPGMQAEAAATFARLLGK